MAIDNQDLQRLLNQVRTNCPGASDAAIKRQLFEVLDEFFSDSSCWTENIDFACNTSAYDYDLVPAQDGVILRLAGLSDSNDNPIAALMPSPPTLSLQNLRNEVETLTASVVKTVIPPMAASAVPIAPDWVLKRYNRGIQLGVIGYLQMQANKPYSNNTLALFNQRKFRVTVNQARTDALHRNTHGAQAWVFPRGGLAKGYQKSGVSIGSNVGFNQ